jgi:Bacterial membrane protein YfhO
MTSPGCSVTVRRVFDFEKKGSIVVHRPAPFFESRGNVFAFIDHRFRSQPCQIQPRCFATWIERFDMAHYHQCVVGVKAARSSEGADIAEEPSATESPTATLPARSRWPDVLGVLWVVIAACLALVPALLHGKYIGSYDDLSVYGLTKQPGVQIHNFTAGDETDEVIPWITLAWTQVHHGHLPLWNANEALGMPLAFNFGSGAFSLPALVSYLTPLRVVYWVQIVVSLIVGGTGAYFFGRVLRLHPIACVFAGTTWVLSGPMFGYLGLPDTSVMSWAGWQFAAVMLIVRGTHRYRSVLLFAVALAFSILAGNPQIEVLILLPLVVFAAVLLLCRTSAFRGSGPIRRPTIDLVVAFIAGGALSAPLVLPGLQLADASIRNSASFASANPLSQVLGLFFQSFWGLPLHGNFVDPQGFYPEQWVWVGAIAVVLAVAAVGTRWRRPEVIGLAAAAVVAAAASVLQPVDSILNRLPLIGHSWWARSLIPLAFCMSILAGIGLDAVLRPSERRRATRWALGGFGATAVMMASVWLFWRGHLGPNGTHIRAESFVWPVVSTAVGLAAFAVVAVADARSAHREREQGRSRWLTLGAVGSLLLCQTAFLIAIDGPLPSSTSTPYPRTPGVVALQRAVGSSLVGLGNNTRYSGGLGLGLAPNTNVPYGVHEFTEYDPIAPLSWFRQWGATNRTSAGVPSVYLFTPNVGSATIARRYGISYVLEPAGAPGPPGGVFDTRVGNETLYRIPGAAIATIVPATSSGGWPAVDAPGTAVPVDWLTPSTARIVTTASSPQVLRLRVASLPGWQATIDGRPLTLSPYLTMMLQAHIPPGRHVIELRYWPNRFTEGIVLAICALLGLAIAGFVVWRRAVRVRGPANPPR